MHTRTFSLIVALVAISTCTAKTLRAQNTTLTVDTTISRLIPKDSANRMIDSYIQSLSNVDDNNLHSLSFDAVQLRNYLNSDSTIRGVKLSLAHTLSYINSGGLNQNSGYKNDALTIVISCYDTDGNVKFIGTSQVMDYAAPCPANCPPGLAAQPLFD